MLETILVAVLPTLLTTAADMIKTFASGAPVDSAQVLATMQTAMNTAQAALTALQTAHAARVAELAAASKAP